MKKACGAALIAMLAAGASPAAKINVVTDASVTSAAAKQGLEIAANYWSTVITNDIALSFSVSFANIGSLGLGGSYNRNVTTQSVVQALTVNPNKGALDQQAILPAFTGSTVVTRGQGIPATVTAGTIDFVRDGPLAAGQPNQGPVLDSNDTRNNATVAASYAQLKALGLPVLSPTSPDGEIQFSTYYQFDFNPTDGIDKSSFDFVAVAVHEIGHALGFFSGVDQAEFYHNDAYNMDNQTIGSILDLFRYSAPGKLDWSVGTPAYFSIDGGATAFNNNAYLSTGVNYGDGNSASHWKASGCNQTPIGLMGPTSCQGQIGAVTADDLAAMDAIGFNVSADVIADKGFNFSTADIYRAYFATQSVPEPATWAMFIGGFGMIGVAMRRRPRVNVRFV